MATDFSVKATDVDAQIEPAARILEPVSREGEINALENIGRGIAVGAKTIATVIRNKSEEKKGKTLADFSIRLNEIDDAMEQGLSPSEGTTRKRALLTQFLANNPQLEEEVLSRYSTQLTQSGFSKIDTEAQQKAKLRQAQVQAAVENGFISADDVGDDAKVEKAVKDLEQFQISVRQLDEETKKLQHASSRLDLTDKQRESEKKVQTDKVIASLAQVGRDSLPYWNARYTEIKNAAAKATSEQERQKIIRDGVLSLQQDFAQRTAAMSGDSLLVGNEKITQIIQPAKDLVDTYVKELSGEYDTEMFKKYSDSAKARSEALVNANLSPEAHQWIALSNMSKAMGDVLGFQLGSVAEQYAKNLKASQTQAAANVGVGGLSGSPAAKPADPLPAGDTETKSVRQYFDTLSTMIGQANRGNKAVDDKVKTEINDQLSAVFRGVDIYANSTQSATEFQPVIDFLSNPEVGKYLQQGNVVPAEFRAGVIKVMQDGYGSYVVPLLKEELGKMYARTMKDVAPTAANMKNLMVKVGDIVEPTMETGRFGFKLKAGVEADMPNRAALNVLNNSAFTKVLNKMVMSNAHISGNTDYKASFEQLAPVIFDENPALQQEGKAGTGEATVQKASYTDPMVSAQSSNLTLEDFDEDVSPWSNPSDGGDLGAELAYASTENSAGPVGAIVAAGKGYTTVQLPDGSIVKRTGSRNWRNNNPGNIEFGSFAKAHGAIGSDGRFAVFPTYEDGRKAKAALLFESKGYKNKSITDAIARYAPDFENDTNAYTNAVANAIGVPASTKLSELTPKQQVRMLNAMERIEGFKPGREVLVASN